MTPEQALGDELRWYGRALRGNADIPAETLQGRVLAYRTQINGRYQCPQCWLRDGAPSDLRAVPGTNEHDVLRCNYDPCGAEYLVPLDD